MRRTYRSKKEAAGALDHRDVIQNMDEKSSAFDAFYIQNIKQTKRELSCVVPSNYCSIYSHKVRKRKPVKRKSKEVESHHQRETMSPTAYLTPDKSIRVNKILDPFDMLLNSSTTNHNSPGVEAPIEKKAEKLPKKVTKIYTKKRAKKFNYSSSDSYCNESDKENYCDTPANVTDIGAHELIIERQSKSLKYHDESIKKIESNMSLIYKLRHMSPKSSFNTSYKLHNKSLQKSPLCSTPFRNKYRGKSIYQKFSPISQKYESFRLSDLGIKEDKFESDEEMVGSAVLSPKSVIGKFSMNNNESLRNLLEPMPYIQQKTNDVPECIETKDISAIVFNIEESFNITDAEPFLGFTNANNMTEEDIPIIEEENNINNTYDKIAEELVDVDIVANSSINSNKCNTSHSLTLESEVSDQESLYDTCNSDESSDIIDIKNTKEPLVVIERMNDSEFLKYYERMLIKSHGESSETDTEEYKSFANDTHQKTFSNSIVLGNVEAKTNVIIITDSSTTDDIISSNEDPKSEEEECISFVTRRKRTGQTNDSLFILDNSYVSSSTECDKTVLSNKLALEKSVYDLRVHAEHFNEYNAMHSSDEDNLSNSKTYQRRSKDSNLDNKEETSKVTLSKRSNASVPEQDIAVHEITLKEDKLIKDTVVESELIGNKINSDNTECKDYGINKRHSSVTSIISGRSYRKSSCLPSESKNNSHKKSQITSRNSPCASDVLSPRQEVSINYEIMEDHTMEKGNTVSNNQITSKNKTDSKIYLSSSGSEEVANNIENSPILNCASKSYQKCSYLQRKSQNVSLNKSEERSLINMRKSSLRLRTDISRNGLNDSVIDITPEEANEPNDETVVGSTLKYSLDLDREKSTGSNSTKDITPICPERSSYSGLESKSGIVLQPGKKWERSLSIYRRMTTMTDCFDQSVLEDYRLQKKGRKYRQSVINTMEMQEHRDSLYNVSINSRRSSICSKPGRPTVRLVKDPSISCSSLNTSTVYEDLEGFLNEECDDTVVELSKLSIAHSEHEVTILDNFHESERVVTARDYVLRRCNQTESILFDECYPEPVLKNCHKIGEGVYGEVFLWRARDGRARVMKIVPIAGNVKVNGEDQKDYHEIISEIVIAMELSALRSTIPEIERQLEAGEDVLHLHDIQNATDIFNEVVAVRCVHGPYPSRLLDLWELYDESKGSENDNPVSLPPDQSYIVLELANAGQDLESYRFTGAQQAHALFQQLALGLAVAEESFQFEHRDLHWGNVLIAPTEQKQATFILRGRTYRTPRHGVAATIIDYSLSRLSLPLSTSVNESAALYNDLATDEQLFDAVGDYQFEVYRLMRDKLGNDWKNFEPYTNILWLHYTVDKMITALRYKRTNTKIHKHYIEKLKDIKERILEYGSCIQYVLNNIEY